MKKDYVKKGLAIGVIVLFVYVGISSAVALKGINLNNNDIINSSNVVSTEDLPDLQIENIHTLSWEPSNPFKRYLTIIEIANIGNANINEYVNFKILVYRIIGFWAGIEQIPILIGIIGLSSIKLDLEPGDWKYIWRFHGIPGLFYIPYSILKFVVYINYDKKAKESDYRTNVAQIIYGLPRYYWEDWIRIMPITYPSLVPHQLGI